ncbi:hypothetical protein LINGRAHAP2_LOCUS28829, partial [Linum grandiflorum]
TRAQGQKCHSRSWALFPARVFENDGTGERTERETASYINAAAGIINAVSAFSLSTFSLRPPPMLPENIRRTADDGAVITIADKNVRPSPENVPPAATLPKQLQVSAMAAYHDRTACNAGGGTITIVPARTSRRHAFTSGRRYVWLPRNCGTFAYYVRWYYVRSYSNS